MWHIIEVREGNTPDGKAWSYELADDGQREKVRVEISGSALTSDVESLIEPMRRGVITRGQSVLERFLRHSSLPPDRKITITPNNVHPPPPP